jgi:hypothetical protein
MVSFEAAAAAAMGPTDDNGPRSHTIFLTVSRSSGPRQTKIFRRLIRTEVGHICQQISRLCRGQIGFPQRKRQSGQECDHLKVSLSIIAESLLN